MKKLLTILVISAFIFSCGGEKKADAPKADETPSVEAQVKESAPAEEMKEEHSEEGHGEKHSEEGSH